MIIMENPNCRGISWSNIYFNVHISGTSTHCYLQMRGKKRILLSIYNKFLRSWEMTKDCLPRGQTWWVLSHLLIQWKWKAWLQTPAQQEMLEHSIKKQVTRSRIHVWSSESSIVRSYRSKSTRSWQCFFIYQMGLHVETLNTAQKNVKN